MFQSSISCDAEHVVDHDERPPYQSYLSRSSTVGSPQGTPQYQLPSPEEDVILDPAFIDKEVRVAIPSRSQPTTTTTIITSLTNSQRRREQNRVAQRAFRERKETKLRQLEKQINKLKTDQNKLERKYHNLRTAHLRLQSGLKILLDASGTFDDFDPEADGYDVDTKS